MADKKTKFSKFLETLGLTGDINQKSKKIDKEKQKQESYKNAEEVLSLL